MARNAKTSRRNDFGISCYCPAPQDTEHVPYYYSADTGWLSFRVNGDPGFRDAVELVIRHLYETGFYQERYKKWHAPEIPDVKEPDKK